MNNTRLAEAVGRIEIEEIMRYLPHRYPFLMVDRIVEYEENERMVGVKNVSINEPFFQGHFPGSPIMPGVLILESMAQVGGVLVFKSIPNPWEKLVFLVAIENAKFRRPVRPGDQLRVEMIITRAKGRIGKLRGKAYVEDQLVAQADIMFSLVERPPHPNSHPPDG